jgi:endo-1,4-beta-D-glucanase Y
MRRGRHTRLAALIVGGTLASLLAVGAVGRVLAAELYPFGSHPMPYAVGIIRPNHVSQATLDQRVRDFYDAWKARFLRQTCGAGRWVVQTDTDAANLTVSEGHGYGMMLMALMAGHEPNARQIFDGMFEYFRAHPTEFHDHLMAWYQNDACQTPAGSLDSASDGDLDIAFALLLADRQWGSCGTINYLLEAQLVLNDVADGEIDASGQYVLLGDWVGPSESTSYYASTRSSDFMPDHTRSFEAATNDATWSAVRDRTYQIVDALQAGFSPDTGLLPDFVKNPLTAPAPVAGGFLEGSNDGRYSYNACRDPWRLGVDAIVSGETRAKAAAQRINVWIRAATGGDPAAIKSGYKLDGTMISGADYLSMAFVAPLGVGAMVDPANQAWLNDVWDLVVATPASTDGYYENTLKLLAMIAMSGNLWAPERVAAGPCSAPTLTPGPTRTPTPSATPVCAATPRADCRTPLRSGASQIALRDRVGHAKDDLQWKWSRGAATTIGDLGDPSLTTRYDLCLYDGTASLIAAAAAPAGGSSAFRAYWTRKSQGFRYARKDGAPNGITSLGLKSGADGKARIVLKAKGTALALPALPIGSLPFTAQLSNGAGQCWAATFLNDLRDDSADAFKARSE